MSMNLSSRALRASLRLAATAVVFQGCVASASMLVEAHRTGHVVLGSADIKNKESLKDVQDSAIVYKNTVWHFICVEN